MTKKDDTLIVSVLDRSGSMGHLASDVIGGYNAFIKEQRKLPGTASVTLVLFDHQITSVYDRVVLDKVPELTRDVYAIRGTTALLEAVGSTIDRVGAQLKNTPESERPEHVVFVVFTDGLENASGLEWTRDSVAERIRHQTDRYNWNFIYLGANQDSWSEAQAIGYASPNFTFDWSPTPSGIKIAYASANLGATQVRSGSGVDLSDKNFNLTALP